MISAATCKAYATLGVEEYCTKNIEPLLIKSKGQPVYFGKYNEHGTVSYYISKTYAKDPPVLKALTYTEVSPFDIKTVLESFGYKVEWILKQEYYPAGTSTSGRTHYYNAGSYKYYTLKISY